MKRVLVIALVFGVLGFAGGFGVREVLALKRSATERVDAHIAFQGDFFAALRNGNVEAIKALSEPAIAQRVVDQLGEKGLIKASDVWVRTAGWSAPRLGLGSAWTGYYGLEAKDAGGKAVPFRIGLASSPRSGGGWVWRITDITFDVTF